MNGPSCQMLFAFPVGMCTQQLPMTDHCLYIVHENRYILFSSPIGFLLLYFPLLVLYKELNEIERLLKHDTKRVDHSGIAELKSEKGRLNSAILNLKREIKKANKERVKKLKKL